MAKVFTSGAVLPAADLNTNMMQQGTAGWTRIAVGSNAYNLVSANSQNLTVNWGFTFSQTPKVVAMAQSSSNIDFIITVINPTATGCTLRIAEKSGTNVTQAAVVFWIAIGPP